MPESPIVEKIWESNEGNKHINGHSPEYIARHMGESVEELFPPDLRCLYIGDPWQKLDAKGVTIIDYEFGPVVEYRATKSELQNRLREQYYRATRYNDRTWQGKHEKKDLPPNTPEAFSATNLPLVDELIKQVENAQLDDYPKIAKKFDAFRQKVEEEIAGYGLENDDRETTSEEEMVISLWYLAVEGARIQDIFDQKTIVGPQIEKFAKNLPRDLSKDEKRKLIWQKNRELVEKIRLKKTTKEADVAQAIFPELPFADESFDRLVAYYSISTYVFPALDYPDFMRYWSEIDRVLKVWGRAYIGPLYSTDNSYDESVKAYQEAHPEIYFLEDYMPDIPPVNGMRMLMVGKVAKTDY